MDYQHTRRDGPVFPEAEHTKSLGVVPRALTDPTPAAARESEYIIPFALDMARTAASEGKPVPGMKAQRAPQEAETVFLALKSR
jgi:hypothetical protein